MIQPPYTLRSTCLATLLCLSFLSGCASPVALHRAVLEYDWTVNRIETELLLLNIARMRYHEPIHFTVVSSIAATFDFRVNTGITGVLSENPGFDSLSLTLGASAAENPTVSIIPIQGEEFTKRLLTPISENTVQFLADQGIDPSILLRLMARGMILEKGKQQPQFLLNQPHRKEEYREFRQRVMHLSWLQSERHLFIGPLKFHIGSERKPGRMAITNYNPDLLSNEERLDLNEKAERFSLNHILVDIRNGHPGGDFPMFGQIKLRSFKAILGFIGRGIGEDQEFQVDPDPRTKSISVNPVQTLTIQESSTQPEEAIISTKKRGLWYYIDQETQAGELEDRWNHEAFDLLYQLYHLTVTDISQTPTVPITISK
jgi:hypothetical protein